MFQIPSFNQPSAEYAPGYFWIINDCMDEKVLRSQVRDMIEKGAGTIVPHPVPAGFSPSIGSKMEPEYLSDEYFRQFRFIVEECQRSGGKCFLYDEGGWPSGSAYGKVYASDPERFAMRYLQLDGKGGYEICTCKVDPELPRTALPNLLMREVTEKFLELTHEQYYRHFGDQFGKIFQFSFMDEPAVSLCRISVLPWTWDFFEEFAKRKGYDVEPFIVPMLEDSQELEVIRVRADYTDVVSQLFTERFMRPIREWCKAHGIGSGGHHNGESDLHWTMCHGYGGQILRVLREMDLPGVDMIWRQLWCGEKMHPFPKLASSTAHQNGNPRILGEVFAVYGNGLTFDQMKFLIDYMICCGVNLFVLSARPMGTAGKLSCGTRPMFGPFNPMWRLSKPFHDYTARLSMLSAESVPAVDTALFYDMRSLWKTEKTTNSTEEQDQIAYCLLERQVDYDYIDDDVLETAGVSNGKLQIGKAEYSYLVIPHHAMMTDKAAENLERLKQAGLRVLSQDQIETIPPTLKIGNGDSRFRVRKMIHGDDVLYFVINLSGESGTVSLCAEESFSVARCDAGQGRFIRVPHSANGCWDHKFDPYSAEVFLVGASAEEVEEPAPEPGETVLELKEGWSLKPVYQYKVGEEDLEQMEIRDVPFSACKTGDWRAVLGDDFSGDAVYRNVFTVEDPAGISYLDLGKVNYAAEVVLNGKNLGTRIFSPFCFAVGDALNAGENILEIKVTNTFANAISPERVKTLWDSYFTEPSAYDEKQRTFERDTLASGLFGPVRFKKKEKQQ